MHNHWALLSVVALAGCSLPDGEYFGKIPDPLDTSTLRICNSGEPEYVDPALLTSTTGDPLGRLLFAGLLEYGTDLEGTAQADLAERWEVSPDMRTFRFHLRDGIKWSNGREIVASDWVYHVTRILHPSSISRNVEPLKVVKNAELFNARRVKMLTEDVAPFFKGDIVEIIGRDGKELSGDKLRAVPSSNLRVSSKAVKLRDLGADESTAYATVPAGEELDIVELGGPGNSWAYVFWSGGGWFYGWVPVAELNKQPNGAITYTVREVAPEHRVHATWQPDTSLKRRQGQVAGTALLATPEVLGIYAEGDKTLVIETWGPTPTLLDSARDRILRPTPREAVSRSPKRWTYPEDGFLVTSGPYTTVEWKERDKMVFDKSPTYHNADRVKTERMVVYSMDDQVASANLYFQGGCDVLVSSAVPSAYLPALKGDKRGNRPYKDLIIAPYLGIYYYVINTEKVPNVHLRRALSHAIDRRPLPGFTHGGEKPTSSFIPGRAIATLSDAELKTCGLTKETKGFVSFVTPENCYHSPNGPDFDVAKAKEELELAKKEMGDAYKPTIEVKFNSGKEKHKIIAEFIQDQWKNNLGIDVVLKVQEWKTYLKDTTAGKFEVGRLGWIGSTPDPESEFLLVFNCTDGKPSPYNRSRWCNDEYDRLYRAAGQVMDRKKRLEILRKAEEIMINEMPIIPLYVYTQQHLRKPYVAGMSVQLGDKVPWQWAYIDTDWKAKLSTKSETGSGEVEAK